MHAPRAARMHACMHLRNLTLYEAPLLKHAPRSTTARVTKFNRAPLPLEIEAMIDLINLKWYASLESMSIGLLSGTTCMYCIAYLYSAVYSNIISRSAMYQNYTRYILRPSVKRSLISTQLINELSRFVPLNRPTRKCHFQPMRIAGSLHACRFHNCSG